jgi:hypothetical protein
MNRYTLGVAPRTPSTAVSDFGEHPRERCQSTAHLAPDRLSSTPGTVPGRVIGASFRHATHITGAQLGRKEQIEYRGEAAARSSGGHVKALELVEDLAC